MPTIVTKITDDKKNLGRIKEIYTDAFLFGVCGAFALALHQGLGWPLVILMRGSEECHVAVRTPDGQLFDVRGPMSKEDVGFGEPYSCVPPYDLRNVKQEDVRQKSAIKPIGSYDIKIARGVAETLFPGLPWDTTLVSRVSAFADDLEALCRKHKLWIRSPNPNNMPIVTTEFGMENGYDLHQTMDGSEFMLNRRLKNS